MVGERRCSGKEFRVLGAATRKLRLPNSVLVDGTHRSPRCAERSITPANFSEWGANIAEVRRAGTSDNVQPLLVGGQLVSPVKYARNLRILLDAELTMDVQASAVVKGCFYQLRSGRRSLDYCNAVLYGAAKTTIQRLQTVMNAAARSVGGVQSCINV